MTAQIDDNSAGDSKPTSKEIEVLLRRQKIWSLYKQGFSQVQIAEKLGVSTKTISRDFEELKNEAIEWMDALPHGEVQLHHKKSLESVEKVLRELWTQYDRTKGDNMKLKILNTIAEKTKMHADMLTTRNVLEIRKKYRYENIKPPPSLSPKFSIN